MQKEKNAKKDNKLIYRVLFGFLFVATVSLVFPFHVQAVSVERTKTVFIPMYTSESVRIDDTWPIYIMHNTDDDQAVFCVRKGLTIPNQGIKLDQQMIADNPQLFGHLQHIYQQTASYEVRQLAMWMTLGRLGHTSGNKLNGGTILGYNLYDAYRFRILNYYTWSEYQNELNRINQQSPGVPSSVKQTQRKLAENKYISYQYLSQARSLCDAAWNQAEPYMYEPISYELDMQSKEGWSFDPENNLYTTDITIATTHQATWSIKNTENLKDLTKLAGDNNATVTLTASLEDLQKGPHINIRLIEPDVQNYPDVFGFYTSDGQTFVTLALPETIIVDENITYNWTVPQTQLELFKTRAVFDENVPEEGSVFLVYPEGQSFEDTKENEKDTITTDAQGYAISKDLPIGTYIVRQIGAPEASVLADDHLAELFDPNEKYDLVIVNQSVMGKVEINKAQGACSDFGDQFDVLLREEGAVFFVYSADFENYDRTPDELKDKLITDENGWAQSKDLIYGTYRIEQCENEIFDFTRPAKPFDVIIAEHEHIYQFNIINEVQMALEIEKTKMALSGAEKISVDHVGHTFVVTKPVFSDEPAEDVSFDIYVGLADIYRADGTIKTYQGQQDDIALSQGAYLGSIVTNIQDDGRAVAGLDGLLLDATTGKAQYIAIESTPPQGHMPHKKPIIFTYDVNQKAMYHQTKAISNQRKWPELVIEKEAQVARWCADQQSFVYDLVPADRVVFGIYTAKPLIDKRGQEHIFANELVELMTTNEDGKAISRLKLTTGDYYIKELVPNRGYHANQAQYPFVITDDNDISFKNDDAIVNLLHHGDIIVEKIDDRTQDALEHVVFELLDEEKNIIDHRQTDENGQAIFDQIPYGRYYLREKSAPEGYIPQADILLEPNDFPIDEDGFTWHITVPNRRDHQALGHLIKTGQGFSPLSFVGWFLVSGGIIGISSFVVVTIKKQRQKNDGMSDRA